MNRDHGSTNILSYRERFWSIWPNQNAFIHVEIVYWLSNIMRNNIEQINSSFSCNWHLTVREILKHWKIKYRNKKNIIILIFSKERSVMMPWMTSELLNFSTAFNLYIFAVYSCLGVCVYICINYSIFLSIFFPSLHPPSSNPLFIFIYTVLILGGILSCKIYINLGY